VSHSGTAADPVGSSTNVGTPPAGLSVGLFTSTDALPVTISAGAGGNVTIQGGTAVLQVPASQQVTMQPLPPARPDLYGGSGPGGPVGSPPTSSSVSYLIGTLT